MLYDMEHRDMVSLEQGLAQIRRAPKDAGTVELIVRRPTPEEREVLYHQAQEIFHAVFAEANGWPSSSLQGRILRDL